MERLPRSRVGVVAVATTLVSPGVLVSADAFAGVNGRIAFFSSDVSSLIDADGTDELVVVPTSVGLQFLVVTRPSATGGSRSRPAGRLQPDALLRRPRRVGPHADRDGHRDELGRRGTRRARSSTTVRGRRRPRRLYRVQPDPPFSTSTIGLTLTRRRTRPRVGGDDELLVQAGSTVELNCPDLVTSTCSAAGSTANPVDEDTRRRAIGVVLAGRQPDPVRGT